MSQRIAVVGGGISGLAAAFYLNRQRSSAGLDFKIDLLEADTRLGGVIRSVQEDGLLLEAGPEGWASYKPAAKQLIRDLCIEDQVIGSNDERRKTFISRGGRLEALPNGMAFFAPVDPVSFWLSAPLSLKGKLRASFEPFVRPCAGDLSVQEFFERRLGREFTEGLVEPLISAILGSDYRTVSALSALPELYRAEQRAGSLWKGLRRFAKMTSTVSVLHTMRQGMGQLTEEICRQLGDTTLHLGLGRLSFEARSGRYIFSGQGLEEVYDRVVFSTPAYVTAELISGCSRSASEELEKIPYNTSSLVYLSFKKDDFSHPMDGFGFIVPRSEAGLINAGTWVSTKFDGRCPDDRVLIRCAVHSSGDSVQSDEELIERVLAEVRQLMDFSCLPTTTKLFHTRKALPQLLVGHSGKLSRIRRELEAFPRLHISASYWGGVGVPDCIRTARETAETIVKAYQQEELEGRSHVALGQTESASIS